MSRPTSISISSMSAARRSSSTSMRSTAASGRRWCAKSFATEVAARFAMSARLSASRPMRSSVLRRRSTAGEAAGSVPATTLQRSAPTMGRAPPTRPFPCPRLFPCPRRGACAPPASILLRPWSSATRSSSTRFSAFPAIARNMSADSSSRAGRWWRPFPSRTPRCTTAP